MHQNIARFRDLRPPKTDTNIFTYHLKALQQDRLVEKNEAGYTLSQRGLMYVDRVSTEKITVRSQPKIITMLLVQNSDGDILLQKRNKQPYIDTWTLPYGKLHIDDESIEAAAVREAKEKLGVVGRKVRHSGDCYIRAKLDDEILSTTMVHVFRFEKDDIKTSDTIMWAQPYDLLHYKLAPAVKAIVNRSFLESNHFFAEFEEDWQT